MDKDNQGHWLWQDCDERMRCIEDSETRGRHINKADVRFNVRRVTCHTNVNYLSYGDGKALRSTGRHTMCFDQLLLIVEGGDVVTHSPDKAEAGDTHDRRKERVPSDTLEEEFLP